MQLTPRYAGEPVLVLDGRPDAAREPAARQLRRFAELLATLDDDQWAHPSRCEGWSARDVVVHLETAIAFWSISIQCGLRGEPTRFLATFDPVATPVVMVAASEMTGGETCEQFDASTRAFVELLDSLGDDDWTTVAEAPPGHIAIGAVVHHALWDAWIHERDVMLPLGLAPTVEADEVAASLRYAIGLSPAFAVTRDPSGRGTLTLAATRPDLGIMVSVADGRVVVGDAGEIDRPDLAGDAVDLLEAISLRHPFEPPPPAHVSWLLEGLATTFDQPIGPTVVR